MLIVLHLRCLGHNGNFPLFGPQIAVLTAIMREYLCSIKIIIRSKRDLYAQWGLYSLFQAGLIHKAISSMLGLPPHLPRL